MVLRSSLEERDPALSTERWTVSCWSPSISCTPLATSPGQSQRRGVRGTCTHAQEARARATYQPVCPVPRANAGPTASCSCGYHTRPGALQRTRMKEGESEVEGIFLCGKSARPWRSALEIDFFTFIPSGRVIYGGRGNVAEELDLSDLIAHVQSCFPFSEQRRVLLRSNPDSCKLDCTPIGSCQPQLSRGRTTRQSQASPPQRKRPSVHARSPRYPCLSV